MAQRSICFDPRDDDKLGVGWPNLIVALDGHRHDRAPEKSAEKAYRAGDPVYFTEWPRETLMRYLRVEAAVTLATAAGWNDRKAEEAKLAEDALGVAGMPPVDDLVAGLRRMFRTGDEIYGFQTRSYVFGVECVVGTDLVVQALTDEIDAFDPGAHAAPKGDCMGAMVDALGFLLLRASVPVREAARVRLAPVYERLQSYVAADQVRGRGLLSYARSLDCALYGAVAVRRAAATATANNITLDIGELGGLGRPECAVECAHDDPGLVRELVAKAERRAPMSVRVVAIGGTRVLAGIALRKWPASQWPSVVRDFGMIRAPEVVDLMLSVVGKSSLKGGPLAWFRAHADFSAPILARSRVAAAKPVLLQLE